MFLLLCFIFICNALCFGKVTEKQYASMPELFHQDNYDKCMLLKDEALYCSFTYEMQPLNARNVSEIWRIIKEVSSDEFNYRHDHLRHGICVPVTCPSNETSDEYATLRQRITNCYNRKYENVGLKGTVTSLQCETNEPRYPVDWLDIFVAIAFVWYVALIAFASFYEGFARYKSEADYQKITSTCCGRVIAAFSIPRNWQIFKTVKSTPDVEKLRSVQGVRFYNMILVIFSHTALAFSALPVVNTKYMEEATEKVVNIFLVSGALCVSTNFFISSFLLCHGIFSSNEGRKEVSPKLLLMTFIKRYIRLTPTLAMTILFHATWLRHLGSGPNWNNLVGKEYLRCRKYGWINLLYLNNIIDSGNMCLGTTWYLALDTQYFIILLFIVWFLKKYPKLIWPTLGCLLSINIIATFIRNYKGNYEIFLMPKPEVHHDARLIHNNPQYEYQYVDEIGSAAGGIIGLGYGYIFYKYKNQKLFTSNLMFYQILYYCIFYGLGLIILTLMPGIVFMIYRAPHSAFWSSVYMALSRPMFSFVIGYGLFGATQGLGWLTKYCMEWSPTYILGRLSYSAYLIHMSVVGITPAIARSPVYIHGFSILRDLMGNVCISYLAALLITLSLEMPILELQKLILSTKQELKRNSKED